MDGSQLTQLFQNLLANAVKFRGEAPPKVHIGVERRGADWEFTVRDNGIGIEAEFQDRVFGLFNKLEADTEGTGIGLALVKRIIEIHEGRIWIESEGHGKGTTFLFTLPEG